MKRRLFCVLLTMVTGAVCCVAQPPHLVFRNLNMSQGISDNHVRSVLKDSYGMMWFVTLNGLNRYDGYRFKRYDIGGQRYWNDALHRVVEDADSNVWVTGSSYVYAYHRESDCIDTCLQERLTKSGISVRPGGEGGSPRGTARLFVDKDRNLWYLSGQTLYYYDFSRRTLTKLRLPRGVRL